MRVFIFVLSLFLFACGSDDKSTTPSPQPTPTNEPAPEIELSSSYVMEVDGVPFYLPTGNILGTTPDVVDAYFLAGELREGLPSVVCQAKMRLQDSGFNSYHLQVYESVYSEFNDLENALCASFNGSYWITLVSYGNATIRRTN